jgi:hypothetical protein
MEAAGLVSDGCAHPMAVGFLISTISLGSIRTLIDPQSQEGRRWGGWWMPEDAVPCKWRH